MSRSLEFISASLRVQQMIITGGGLIWAPPGPDRVKSQRTRKFNIYNIKYSNKWASWLNIFIKKIHLAHNFHKRKIPPSIFTDICTYSKVSIKRPGLNFSKKFLLNDQLHLRKNRTVLFTYLPNVSIKSPRLDINCNVI